MKPPLTAAIRRARSGDWCIAMQTSASPSVLTSALKISSDSS